MIARHGHAVAAMLVAMGCGRWGFDSSAQPDGEVPAHDAPVMPAPDAGVCTAASQLCADSVTLRTCAAAGAQAVDTICGWGCIAEPGAHCGVLVPSGGGVLPTDVSSTGLSGSIDLQGTVNADDGSITGLTTRAAGTGIIDNIDYELRGNVAVFRFASVRVIGSLGLTGSHAIALVADQGVYISGVIDATVGCGGTRGGAGGYAGGGTNANGTGPGHGTTPGFGGSYDGGGGAGYAGTGGTGGGNSAAAGGPSYGAAPVPALIGGSGGAGARFLMGGGGGGGGGAVQLVSNASITVTASGAIDAGGCGGRGSGEGGGGGGAGGAILLEAPMIAIDGALAVNGGGGGAGNGTSGSNGLLGRSPTPAGSSGAPGGIGAAGAMLDGASGTGGMSAGGGGGGIGWIRIDSRTGSATVDNTQLSPALTDAPTTCTEGPAAVQ